MRPTFQVIKKQIGEIATTEVGSIYKIARGATLKIAEFAGEKETFEIKFVLPTTNDKVTIEISSAEGIKEMYLVFKVNVFMNKQVIPFLFPFTFSETNLNQLSVLDSILNGNLSKNPQNKIDFSLSIIKQENDPSDILSSLPIPVSIPQITFKDQDEKLLEFQTFSGQVLQILLAIYNQPKNLKTQFTFSLKVGFENPPITLSLVSKKETKKAFKTLKFSKKEAFLLSETLQVDTFSKHIPYSLFILNLSQVLFEEKLFPVLSFIAPDPFLSSIIQLQIKFQKDLDLLKKDLLFYSGKKPDPSLTRIKKDLVDKFIDYRINDQSIIKKIDLASSFYPSVFQFYDILSRVKPLLIELEPKPVEPPPPSEGKSEEEEEKGEPNEGDASEEDKPEVKAPPPPEPSVTTEGGGEEETNEVIIELTEEEKLAIEKRNLLNQSIFEFREFILENYRRVAQIERTKKNFAEVEGLELNQVKEFVSDVKHLFLGVNNNFKEVWLILETKEKNDKMIVDLDLTFRNFISSYEDICEKNEKSVGLPVIYVPPPPPPTPPPTPDKRSRTGEEEEAANEED